MFAKLTKERMKRSVTHIILKNIDKTKQYILVKYPWVFSLFFCVQHGPADGIQLALIFVQHHGQLQEI